MAKLEATLHGNFSAILNAIDTAVLEDESHFQSSSGRCVLRVYERYSALGGNRVSLSVLLLETAHGVRLSAIASGGSQAMFLKLNTFGEEAFLESISEAVARYQ